MARIATGGRIDRARPVPFVFDGRAYTGLAGDTLASALMANDVLLLGRSFKYHRPRGQMAAGDDEPNALVQLEPGTPFSEPNVRATRIELYEGLSADSVNRWPSLAVDVSAAADLFHRFLPAGFYNKVFKWPDWHLFEGLVRRSAGLGVVPPAPDPETALKRHARCDVLVVGGGPAGIAAARAAAAAGRSVVLAESDPELGGSLLARAGRIDGGDGLAWIRSAAADLSAAGVTLLTRTTVTGLYDHGLAVAVERIADHLPPGRRAGLPRQRIWHVRAGRIVLATGAQERPLVFPDNDRPGIILASAAESQLARYAVAAGRRAVVVANDDAAVPAALALARAGVTVAAFVDLRAGQGHPALSAAGIPVYSGAAIDRVAGRARVRAVRIAPRSGESGIWIDADHVLMSGGREPALRLFTQGGGRVRYDEGLAAFVPDGWSEACRPAGAAAARFDLAAALADGHEAGGGGSSDAPRADAPAAGRPIEPVWRVAGSRRRQWVDFQSDSTLKDVEIAAREGYVSVEHLKRYTTIGMSSDQGRTSSTNALALMGELTGRTPGEVGASRIRPPIVPIAMTTVAAGRRGGLFAPRRLTPIDGWNRDAAARMEDYGAWVRAEAYVHPGETLDGAATREQRTVRGAVGLFDSSPIGKIAVEGRDAARFLDFMLYQRMDTLAVGRGRWHLMLNEHGVIVDDGVTFRLAEDRFLVTPSSGAAPRVFAAFDEWRQCEFPDLDVRLADLTAARAAVAVSGPRARDLLAAFGIGLDLAPAAFPHLAIRETVIGTLPATVMRVSFSGELTYEIQVPARAGLALWRALLEAGRPFGATPVGVEAWLRLRVEKGYLHVGGDTDGTTLPDDVGAGAILAKKPGDFVGRRSLLREDARRTDREQLVGLASDELLPVGAVLVAGERPGGPAVREGRVTSSVASPTLGRPVAMGLVRSGRARMGETLSAHDGGRVIRTRIVPLAAYDPEGERLAV